MPRSQVGLATTTQPNDRITVARCCDDHVWILEDHEGDVCPSCGAKWKRSTYTTRGDLRRRMKVTQVGFNVHTFKPYTEDGFTGHDIPIENRDQRDELCEAHGLSYDSCKGVSPPNVPPAIDSITPGDLKAALEDPEFLTKDEDTVRDDCMPDIPDAPDEVEPDDSE